VKRKALVLIFSSIFVLGIAESFCLAETIKLEIPSGVKIKCFYYKSDGDEKRPTILVLPGLSGLRNSHYNDMYEDLAKLLKRKYNFNVLAIDYRAKTNEEMFKIVNREGGSKTLVEQEVVTAIDFLRKQKNADDQKIGVAGFSLGTIVAIRTAAREDCVKALALVSLIVGSDEDVKQEFMRCADRPILFLAAKDDHIPQNKTNAAENTFYWSQQAKGNKKVEITKGKMHAAELLELKGMKEMIGDWFKEHL
jgi:dienelactone hydrolase